MACSFLRPMDPRLFGVITEAMASHKVEINYETGQQMMNELDFYEIDVEWLGSESEADQTEEDEDATLMRLIEKKKKSLEEDIDGEEMKPM